MQLASLNSQERIPPPAPPVPVPSPWGLQPQPQLAYDKAHALVPEFEAAMQRLRAGFAADRLDRDAVRMANRLASEIGPALYDLSIGRWTHLEKRRELARGLAERFSAAMLNLNGSWAVPAAGMKSLHNIERGAERVAAATKKPGMDLSTSEDGWGISQLINGWGILTSAGLGGLRSEISGSEYRTIGLARVAHDAILRIDDGLRAVSPKMFFRASKQAEMATALLRDLLADGQSHLPAHIAGTLTAALDGAIAAFEPDGHDLPAGVEGYTAAISQVRDAAQAALAVLDAAAAPLIAVGGDEGATRTAWRAVQRVPTNGPYHDPDIGW